MKTREFMARLGLIRFFVHIRENPCNPQFILYAMRSERESIIAFAVRFHCRISAENASIRWEMPGVRGYIIGLRGLFRIDYPLDFR